MWSIGRRLWFGAYRRGCLLYIFSGRFLDGCGRFFESAGLAGFLGSWIAEIFEYIGKEKRNIQILAILPQSC
jgi:hypothetical protein